MGSFVYAMTFAGKTKAVIAMGKRLRKYCKDIFDLKTH